MTRNLKALGLALLAAFALSGVMASAASAEPADFTAEIGAGETASIHGGQIGTDTYTIGGKLLTCQTSTVVGEALEPGAHVTEVTLTPNYQTCHMVFKIGGINVTRTTTVTMNSCDYRFNATKNTGGFAFSADLTIECEDPNDEIELHIYSNAAEPHSGTVLCTFDIPHQTITDEIELTNTANHDIVAHVEAEIATTSTIQNATCGSAANPSLLHLGEETLTATNEEGNSVGTTVS